MVNGVEREFEAVGHAEFVEDVVEMIFDGLFGDEKLFPDFLVAEALSDELNDFFFAVAEQRFFSARASFGRLRESLHYFGSHAIVEPDFASVNAMNAFNEKVRSRLLQDDAASAKAHGADDVAIIFSSGQHDNARGKGIEIDFFEDGEAVFVGHAKIEQQNVGLELREELDALDAILRFANDGDVFVGIEEFA